MKSENRKRNIKICIRVTSEEYTKIKDIADATAQSKSSYLRNIGTGYQPHGRIDQLSIKELMKINADLGRLGGLLKHLFFSKHDASSDNTSSFKPEVNNLLREFKKIKDQLEEKIIKL